MASIGGGFGARAVIGGGDLDSGFTQVGPPGTMVSPGSSVFDHGSTWFAIGAVVWLGILYAHWHTY